MNDTLDRAVVAAMKDAADQAILPHYRTLSDSQIFEKEPGDLVTVADRESEAILSEHLARIEPDAAIVGEEACAADPARYDGLSAALCWIIDPIDGTHNFAHGTPPFGVMIALAVDGETERAWIFDPLTGRLCKAQRGKGAFLDDAPITARPTGEKPPIAAISTMYVSPSQRDFINTQVAPDYQLADIPRCAAEQYPRLALGTNDIALFERTLAWDHAAGVLFLNEAGGKAARPDGRPYRVDQKERGLYAASSAALFDAFAERMADFSG